MPKPLYAVGQTFTCTVWLPGEYANITSVAKGRVNFTRFSINDPEVAVRSGTTSKALRNLHNAGVVMFRVMNTHTQEQTR